MEPTFELSPISLSHIQGAEAVEKMTQFAYRQFSGGMLERDRLLLAYSLVLQLEMSQGGFTLQEIAYLLRPSPGRQFAVRGLAAQAGLDLSSSSAFSLGKRPYDWILESQWQALLVSQSERERERERERLTRSLLPLKDADLSVPLGTQVTEVCICRRSPGPAGQLPPHLPVAAPRDLHYSGREEDQ